MTTQEYFALMFRSAWFAGSFCAKWALKDTLKVTEFVKTQTVAAHTLATSEEAKLFYRKAWRTFLLLCLVVVAFAQFVFEAGVFTRNLIDDLVERCLTEDAYLPHDPILDFGDFLIWSASAEVHKTLEPIVNGKRWELWLEEK